MTIPNDAALAALLGPMRGTEQTAGLSVLDHGVMVADRFRDLAAHVREGVPLRHPWRLPDWAADPALWERLPPDGTLVLYQVAHDCGKPACLVVGEDGRRHFPDHARVSRETWLAAGGCPEVGDLIGMDMDVHLLKDEGVAAFAARPQAAALLVTGLCEIHANAALFGGVESTSFKIKHKQVDRRGKAILARWRERPGEGRR